MIDLEKDENGNIILSSNLATVTDSKNGLQIKFSERSNQKEIENRYLDELAKLIEKYNIKIIKELLQSTK